VAQSHYEAVRWYRLAAAQGHPVAIHNLGTIVSRKRPQDDREALHCFKRALRQRAPKAAAAVKELEALFAANAPRRKRREQDAS